jgi:hypothetical protein
MGSMGSHGELHSPECYRCRLFRCVLSEDFRRMRGRCVLSLAVMGTIISIDGTRQPVTSSGLHSMLRCWHW